MCYKTYSPKMDMIFPSDRFCETHTHTPKKAEEKNKKHDPRLLWDLAGSLYLLLQPHLFLLKNHFKTWVGAFWVLHLPKKTWAQKSKGNSKQPGAWPKVIAESRGKSWSPKSPGKKSAAWICGTEGGTQPGIFHGQCCFFSRPLGVFF